MQTAAIVVLLVLSACSPIPRLATPAPTARLSPEETGWHACMAFVRRDLGVSVSRAVSYEPNDVRWETPDHLQVTIYDSARDAVYRCSMYVGDDGSWQLQRLEEGK